jgi:FkbM family methyltransferase
LDPASGVAVNAIGRCLLLKGKHYEAADAFTIACALLPASPEPLVNLAAANIAYGDYTHAEWACSKAVKLNKQFPAAYSHWAAALERQEKWDAAEDIIRMGLLACSDDHDLLYAQAMYLLKSASTPAEWKRAWECYEHRPAHVQLVERLDNIQEWKGESLKGHNLLVCAEQGLGDQIMFARYIPALALAADKVHAHVRPELVRLFVNSFASDGNTAKDLSPRVHITTTESELPADIDRWVAMGSLPAYFEHIPNPHPSYENPVYRQLRLRLNERYLAGERRPINDGVYRVGLCWRGNPAHYQDPMRSVSFDAWRPLLELPECRFFSLQQDDTESGLVNLCANSVDMQETADEIDALDLVITVDTAIAHLAGALGVPFVLIQPTTYSDWRWHRAWYATHLGVARSVTRFPIESLDDFNVKQQSAIAKQAYDNHEVPVANEDVIEIPFTSVSDCRYGRMKYYPTDKWLGRSLETYGEWSESEVDLFRALVKPGDHVADIGANIGSHTIALSAIVGAEGMVHAFEPFPATYKVLLDNITSCLALGDVLLDVRNCALGEREEIIRCGKPDPRNPGGYELKEGDEADIQVRRLDDLDIERLDFAKIDVEGFEMQVLNGGEETIARCRPILYVEADRPGAYSAISHWMMEHGYRVHLHKPPLFNPQNFNGYPTNVWGNIVSLMLLGIPCEKYPEVDGIKNLERVRLKKVGI